MYLAFFMLKIVITVHHFHALKLAGPIPYCVSWKQRLFVVQGHGMRRATCRCTQNTELFTVDIKDFKRILSPLQQGSLQAKMAFLKQVLLQNPVLLYAAAYVGLGGIFAMTCNFYTITECSS